MFETISVQIIKKQIPRLNFVMSDIIKNQIEKLSALKLVQIILYILYEHEPG